MNKNIFLVMMLAFAAAFMAACGSGSNENGTEEENEASGDSEEVTVTHELGETTVEGIPETVVVFDFGALDSLDKLDIEVAGVVQDNLPSYLEKYEGDEYENVGSLQEPDFEKINEINPDLIIISGRQSEAYEELEGIAPTLYSAVDAANYMPSFEESMSNLGQVFNKEAEVEEEVTAIQEQIEEVKAQTEELEGEALVVLANDGSLSAFGPGSRYGLIHDEFGFAPADENIESDTRHGQNVSFEYVAEQDPEHLFVVDRGAVVGGESSSEQVLDNDLMQGTQAVENDNVTYLDPEVWYLSGGGLTSVSMMADEIQTGIEG